MRWLISQLFVLLLLIGSAKAQPQMQCGVVPNNNSSPGTPGEPYAQAPAGPACNDIQSIRVNVHFMQHDDGSGNFNATDDGKPGNPGAYSGYEYAKGLLFHCNNQMDANPVLSLAPGSSLTPIPKRVRWVLDGVFSHENSIYRNSAGGNGSPFRDFDSFCVRRDSVINLFLVEEATTPYINGSPTALPAIRGYMLYLTDCNNYPAPSTLWGVASSPWTTYVLRGGASGTGGAWTIASAVNHELCHLLGLDHPFQGLSTCADAPASANCWNIDPQNPSCDAQSKVSRTYAF